MLGLAALAPRPTILSAQAAAELGAEDGPSAWTQILEAQVDDHGRIDFAGLAADAGRLERHVHWLASHGPVSSPADYASRDAILAYHLNAYNANAMLTVLQNGAGGSLDAWRRVKVFLLSPIRVDDSWTTLYNYENRVIRPLADPRVHFALNCMVKGCPRLPRLPFSAEVLDTQLNHAAQEFVRDQRNVRVDKPRKLVWLSEIFSFYTEDFLRTHESLIAYLNQYRDSADAVPNDFTIQFFPYDWTVNRRAAD